MRAKQKVQIFEELTKKQYYYFEALIKTFSKTKALDDDQINIELHKIINDHKSNKFEIISEKLNEIQS